MAAQSRKVMGVKGRIWSRLFFFKKKTGRLFLSKQTRSGMLRVGIVAKEKEKKRRLVAKQCASKYKSLQTGASTLAVSIAHRRVPSH